MFKVPPKKSIEVLSDEKSRLPVRASDVYKYSDGTLYWVSQIVYGAGTLRGNWFVTYFKVIEKEDRFHFSLPSHEEPFVFCKELEYFLEGMTMHSGQNSQFDDVLLTPTIPK